MTEAKQVNMVLLGPPGAGKGTQAALLIEEFGLLHVSTGDMLREAVKEGNEIGQKVSGYMNSGELVPDEIVTALVIERMSKPDAKRGVILDGYPRTRAQAESLDSSLEGSGKSLTVVLYFKTSEDTAVQRLSGRRVCRACGKNYHVTNMPPAKEGICDACSGRLYQREDDKPETAKKRLVVYNESTKDLIEYYRDKGQLREVAGDIQAEKLFEDVKALFRKEDMI